MPTAKRFIKKYLTGLEFCRSHFQTFTSRARGGYGDFKFEGALPLSCGSEKYMFNTYPKRPGSLRETFVEPNKILLTFTFFTRTLFLVCTTTNQYGRRGRREIEVPWMIYTWEMISNLLLT